MKLFEMERDKFVSVRILQITDKAAPNTNTVFATDFLGIENCHTNARWPLLETFWHSSMQACMSLLMCFS